MDLNEVKSFIESNKDNEEVKTYLQGFNAMSVDSVSKFLNENKDAKSWFDSEKDKHGSKSLETWKTNNLQKTIDEEIKKRFPEADPKDIKMKELELKLENMQKEAFKKELTNTAIKTATEKQLPLEIIDFLLGSDLETTNKNIETFKNIFDGYVQKNVEARISNNAYTPPSGGGNTQNSEVQALQIDHEKALQSGNMPLAIAIKNKIVAIQNKK